MKKAIALILTAVILSGIIPCVIFADTDNIIVTDINGLGYIAADGENLIDINEFDYTCESYVGWTSGDKEPGTNFSIGEGYEGGAIFAETLNASTAEGSINPYIPLPIHTGEETFIFSFRVYSDSVTGIEWSNGYLCDENKQRTEYVLGNFDGTNYRYGVTASSEWALNRIAFTPKASDRYIRIGIGWTSNIGIDDIAIVKAEKYMIEVSERYVDNTTAYDDEPEILGYGKHTKMIQYGANYVSENIPESIEINNMEYVLVSDVTEKWINGQSGEADGKIVFDYRYVKKSELFTHPGLLNTQADLMRIKEAVSNKEEPYISGYNALLANSYAQLGTARAVGTIIRGGTGDNCALLYKDAHRAYLCAIRWKISGDTAYADCARDILNAWSNTLKSISGNADRYLAAGLYGYEMACAAEIMRDYEGFELEKMQDMLMNVFYKPLNERFLYSSEKGGDHNDAHVMNYWANWDLCNLASAAAIGVFCDRRDIYERALNYYKFGAGNGSVYNCIPKLYEASEETLNVPVGQWQEAGRDMEHTQMGIGLMGVVCEIAWNQGDDIYSWGNNRFLYGAEYVAQHHIGNNVPYTTYFWYSGKGEWSSQSGLSGAVSYIRPVYEMIYNHYNKRMGLDTPGLEKLLELNRPENGAASHGSTFDQFGFGTLLYTRDKGDFVPATKHESNVEEGIYRITCRKTGGALTAVENGYVKQYGVDEGNNAQLWKLCDLGGGVYKLINVETGKAMSVENDSYDLQALITTSDYEDKLSQKFAFLKFDDEWDKYYSGYYRIVPVGSGLCIDLNYGNGADGTDILQYTYNSGYHQQWELIPIELKELTVNVLEATGKTGWILNAVYEKNGNLKRVEREVVVPATDSEEFTFNIECDASEGEYVRTYVWQPTLEPAAFEIE